MRGLLDTLDGDGQIAQELAVRGYRPAGTEAPCVIHVATLRSSYLQRHYSVLMIEECNESLLRCSYAGRIPY